MAMQDGATLRALTAPGCNPTQAD